MIKAGLDGGKSYTKYATKIEGNTFTGELPTTVTPSENGNGEYILNVDGKRFIVGEKSERANTEKSNVTKLNETHKHSALVAISRVLDHHQMKRGVKVKATINMPLVEFLNASDRQEILSMYNGSYNITVNDEPYNFELEVAAYYEGLGMAIKHKPLFGKGEEIVVLDMGSLNNGAILYDAQTGKPVIEKSACIRFGFESLKKDIQNAIERTTKKRLSLSQCELIIKKQKKVDIVIEELVDEIIIRHLDSIKAELLDSNIDLDESKVIICGGGALSLRPYLSNWAGHDTIIDVDYQYVNAKYSMELIR